MIQLSNAANGWSTLRMTVGVVLAFCCAMPVVWLLSNLVVDGMRTFSH